MKILSQNKRHKGYTLIESLVASAILMIGIGAAASMSLTMLTQEEVNERTVRAMNHLENAAALYNLGLDSALIEELLPTEPVVTSLTFTSVNRTITNPSGGASLGNVSAMEIEMVFKPASTTRTWANEKWTGGDASVTRTHTVEVFRSSQYVAP